MPNMTGLRAYEVTVSRSAVETATLTVTATSQMAADAKIEAALNTTARVDLTDLAELGNVVVTRVGCEGDDESSWEIS